MPRPGGASGSTSGSGGFRRGNGLGAGTFLPLADLDPRVADAMLRLLYAEGIAAYASPTPGRVGGYLDVTPPPRPTDRLFVDLAQARRAREVVVRVIRESGGRPRVGSEPGDARPAAGREGGALPVRPDDPGIPPAADDDIPSMAADMASPPTEGGSSDPVDPVDTVDALAARSDDPAHPTEPAQRTDPSRRNDPDDREEDRQPLETAWEHPDRSGPPDRFDPADQDAVWQALVASFAVPTPSRTEGLPWPDAEDLPSERRSTAQWPSLEPPHGAGTGTGLAAPVSAAPPPTSGPTRPGDRTRPAADPASLDPLDEEHFVPPAPPPVPRPTGATGWGVASLVGGGAVLFVPAMAGHPVSPGVGFLAVLAVIGGFVTLVVRMRDAPPTDSGPDDGAVV